MRNVILLNVITAASLGSSIQAEAQAGAVILPYTNAWMMSFHGDTGAAPPPALWEDRMDTVTWKGRRALQRTQVEHIKRPTGEATIRYLNVFVPNTLEPLLTERRRGDGVFERAEYDGMRVHEVHSVPGWNAARLTAGPPHDSTVRDFVVGRKFLDFYGGMYAVVMAGRPLKEGTSGTFDALMGDSVVAVRYRVEGREAVRGVGGRPTQATRVQLGSPGDAGGSYTAWISDAPPYVLRLTTPQARPKGYWSWDEVP